MISPSDYTYFLISSIRAAVHNEPEGTMIPLKEILDDRVEFVKGIAEYSDDNVEALTVIS
jgi:hypothetical protein